MFSATPKRRLGVFFPPIAHRLERLDARIQAKGERIEGAEGLIAADDILYYLRPAVVIMYRLTRNDGRRGLNPRARKIMRSLFLASAAQRLAIASALTAAIWAAYFLGKA